MQLFVSSLSHTKQGVALTGRNTTGPTCSVTDDWDDARRQRASL